MPKDSAAAALGLAASALFLRLPSNESDVAFESERVRGCVWLCSRRKAAFQIVLSSLISAEMSRLSLLAALRLRCLSVSCRAQIDALSERRPALRLEWLAYVEAPVAFNDMRGMDVAVMVLATLLFALLAVTAAATVLVQCRALAKEKLVAVRERKNQRLL